MNEKLHISYLTAKKILMELLENNNFSNDDDIKKILNSIVQDKNKESQTKETISRIIVDKNCRIFLPDYSTQEIEMQFLPKMVYLFFLHHTEGVEFKSMHNYVQEMYEIYQVVSLVKNTEAQKIRDSITNLVEPVNNRIYETCSLSKGALSEVVPHSLMELYHITGKRCERHLIQIDRKMVFIENKRLKEIFNF